MDQEQNVYDYYGYNYFNPWMRRFRPKKEKKEVTDISIKDKPKDFQDIKELNIIFKTNTGKENTFEFNYGSTVDKVLSFYITKMNKITEALENQIIFLFNAKRLFFGDQTKIEVFFKITDIEQIQLNFKLYYYFVLKSCSRFE